MKTHTYLLHALSPLHAGTGQGVGLIDLPIARERTTEHPLIPGSSVKGVLREAARQLKHDVQDIFGSTEGSASMVRLSDAHVLAFPVQSDRGTFAWVTSPYILLRFLRDSADAAFAADQVPQVADGHAVVAQGSAVVDAKDSLTLDGLPYKASAANDRAQKLITALAQRVFPKDDATDTTWRGLFTTHLVIVADDAFTWLTRTATDVRAHIRIDEETGTVAKGALWYAETLPPETILAGIVQVGAVREGQDSRKAFDVLTQIAEGDIQIGGNATTGAGRARFVISGGAA